MLLWPGHSVHQMCCGLDNLSSDCVVCCTVIIAMLLLPGQSVQQLCCGLDSQYRDCVVG